MAKKNTGSSYSTNLSLRQLREHQQNLNRKERQDGNETTEDADTEGSEGRINKRSLIDGDFGDEQGNMPPAGGRGPGDDAGDENNRYNPNNHTDGNK